MGREKWRTPRTCFCGRIVCVCVRIRIIDEKCFRSYSQIELLGKNVSFAFALDGNESEGGECHLRTEATSLEMPPSIPNNSINYTFVKFSMHFHTHYDFPPSFLYNSFTRVTDTLTLRHSLHQMSAHKQQFKCV